MSATDAESLALIDDPLFEHLPERDEVVPCTTDQFNHPFPPDRPWARPLRDVSGGVSESRGDCAECGLEVDIERIGPDNPHVFTFIAKPHSRVRRYFVLDDQELGRLVSAMVSEWGSVR